MLPVILLAFANDKQNTGSGYLRGLTQERNAIRDALMKAEENGLCQVVVEPDVTIDRLFDVFQNSAYRDRIAIFHYGGHAESYSLLLESASGAKSTAHSEGLVSFLAKQKSLRLVFLNGCSSQKQSEDLIKAGLPAVIGTSEVINDAIATSLSTRFYKGLSAGMTIEGAWHDSIDQIKTENKSSDITRKFNQQLESILGAPGEDAFPWDLYLGEGGAISRAWNLPEAANQPLFGLELPISYYRKLPLSPYPGLRPFQREEAGIFYGRGQEIRALHNQIHREQPLILVSGKKGVGKSSLLAAGIVPRVENKFTVAFCHVEKKPLLDTLEDLLQHVRAENQLEKIPPKDKSNLESKIAEINSLLPALSGVAKEIVEVELEHLKQLAAKEHLTINEQWISIEQQTGKPLLVLVDELPSDHNEMRIFREILISVFEAKNAPAGKLLLSIDEENHKAFSGLLQDAKFPFAEVFIQPLSWDGIKEAIVGVTNSPITKEYYRLSMETTGANDFPSTLTGELSDSDTTLVAPYLQVILSALWKNAAAENAQTPYISLKAYQAGMVSGEIIDQFLSSQLTQLQGEYAEAVTSGLALDLLYQHTSALGKASILEAGKRTDIYEDREDIINGLIRKYKDLYLLTGAFGQGTNLGHNLLAHVAIRQYSISLSPGQQAARILNGKTSETVESGKTAWLSETDLEVVENGIKGMRRLTREEEALLAYSRVKKIQVLKERKRNSIIRKVLLSVVLIFAVIAAWQWYDANQKYLRSHAGELAFNASEVLELDNTLALNIAREAYSTLEKNSPFLVMQTLSDIFHTMEDMPFYAANFQHKERVFTAVYSPDGQYVLTASEDGFAKLWDTKGKEVLSLPHVIEVSSAKFSPNGQQILTLTRTHVTLWERNGKMTDQDSIPETVFSLDSFSTDGMKIIPAYVDKNASTYATLIDSFRQEFRNIISSPIENRMLDVNYGALTLLNEVGDTIKDSFNIYVEHAIFSPDGKQFLTVTPVEDTSYISVWNENGDLNYKFRCKGRQVNAVFSPDGKSILTASSDFTAKLWDFSKPFVHRFTKQAAAMTMIDYFPEGNTYLTASWDSTAKIWDENGKCIDSLKHGDVVTSAIYSPDGQLALTASRDLTARIWNPKKSQTIILPHKDEVTGAIFSHDGKQILTSSLDQYVRLWDLNGVALDSFHHNERVTSVVFAPNDSLFAAISKDDKVTLWSIQGDSLHAFEHPDNVNSATFSHDGSTLLTSCSDNLVREWSVATYDSLLALVHFEKPKMAIYTADDNRIITAGRMIKIWTAVGMLEDSMVHADNVSSISISPDGRQILATCYDKNAYLWDFHGELLARYRDHSLKITYGCFTPDGSHVMTVADDGYAMRWKTPHAIFVDLKRTPLYKLSKKEEEQYGIVRGNITQDFLYRIKTTLNEWLSPDEAKGLKE